MHPKVFLSALPFFQSSNLCLLPKFRKNTVNSHNLEFTPKMNGTRILFNYKESFTHKNRKINQRNDLFEVQFPPHRKLQTQNGN